MSSTVPIGILGFVFCIMLLCTYFVIYYFSRSERLRWIPAASLLMLCGILITLLLRFILLPEWNPDFNSNVFYYILLPPIIFASGLDIDYACFSTNFITIIVYANLGTIINAVVVCYIMYFVGTFPSLSIAIPLVEGFSFGSLLSATDPVTTLAIFDDLHVERNLYGIIVGVSILDDAVSVILFNLFNRGQDSITTKEVLILFGHFVLKFVGSMMIGHFLGIGFSKFLLYHSVGGSHESETIFSGKLTQLTSFLIFFLYFTYYLGEGFWLSGLITTLFSAISFKKYYFSDLQTWGSDSVTSTIILNDHSSPPSSATSLPPSAAGPPIAVSTITPVSSLTLFPQIKTVISTVASVSESFVFVYIGATLLFHQLKTFSDWKFLLWSVVACLIGRAVQIYPLAFLLNCYNTRSVPQNVDEQLNHDHGHDHTSEVLPMTDASNYTGCPEYFELFSLKKGVSLPIGYQHMIFLAGLRGPIAYATAQLFNNSRNHLNVVAATTGMTVVLTTFLFGILTWPALNWFKVPHAASLQHRQRRADSTGSYQGSSCFSCFNKYFSVFHFGEQDVTVHHYDELTHVTTGSPVRETVQTGQKLRTSTNYKKGVKRKDLKLLQGEDDDEETQKLEEENTMSPLQIDST
jgi:NhaP-type Na+/H+ or K+/H+ antiporter